jgi:hypothetical protein
MNASWMLSPRPNHGRASTATAVVVRGSRPVVRPDRPLQLQEGDEAQGNVRWITSAILMEALSDDVLDVY